MAAWSYGWKGNCNDDNEIYVSNLCFVRNSFIILCIWLCLLGSSLRTVWGRNFPVRCFPSVTLWITGTISFSQTYYNLISKASPKLSQRIRYHTSHWKGCRDNIEMFVWKHMLGWEQRTFRNPTIQIMPTLCIGVYSLCKCVSVLMFLKFKNQLSYFSNYRGNQKLFPINTAQLHNTLKHF